MKKISALALMLVSFGAHAATGTVTASDTPKSNDIANAQCEMISGANILKFTASKSVGVAYNCSTTASAVNAGNTRGKFSYGGGTSGAGGVVKCASGDTADVSTANGYALTPAAADGNGCT